MATPAKTTQLPLLELDTLRVLVAIADTGNFSAAAESVFRTPSAVSMQVKKVEELIGRPLFFRDSRSVTATVDGERLVEHGRRMLALNREAMAHFIEPDLTGVVRMGAPDDMAERLLPRLLRRFADTHCGISVDVVVDMSNKLAEDVRRGSLDLALINCDPNGQGLEQVEIVYTEPLSWAGAKGGVAFEKDPLPVSVWEEGCTWRNLGLQSLENSQKDYRVAFMSAHITVQRAAVLADLAVAPLPISACNNGVVSLDERHGLPRLDDYSVGLILNEELSAAAEAAAEHVRACFVGSDIAAIKSGGTL